MHPERLNSIGREIQDPGIKTEVSPYVWEIIAQPEIYSEIKRLLDNGERELADGQFETSYKHCIDAAKIAEAYADERGDEFSSEEKEIFVTAALLHDIGKERIDNKILTKRGKLSDTEKLNIEKHAYEGWFGCQKIAQALKSSDPEKSETMAQVIAEIVFRHHAYGKGYKYPKPETFHRHEDEEQEAMIAEMAEMISIIDVFDSLRSVRSYRTPAGKSEVEGILRQKFPDQTETIDFLISNFIIEENEEN